MNRDIVHPVQVDSKLSFVQLSPNLVVRELYSGIASTGGDDGDSCACPAGSTGEANCFPASDGSQSSTGTGDMETCSYQCEDSENY